MAHIPIPYMSCKPMSIYSASSLDLMYPHHCPPLPRTGGTDNRICIISLQGNNDVHVSSILHFVGGQSKYFNAMSIGMGLRVNLWGWVLLSFLPLSYIVLSRAFAERIGG